MASTGNKSGMHLARKQAKREARDRGTFSSVAWTRTKRGKAGNGGGARDRERFGEMAEKRKGRKDARRLHAL